MIDQTAVLALRGHHCGCVLAGFRNGTEHPTVSVAIKWLKTHPEGKLRMVVGPDDICIPCPHWTGETCDRGFEEMNCGKDKRFLDLFGVEDGEDIPARELFSRLIDRADLAFFKEVCPKCHPDTCADAAQGDVPF